MTKSTQNHPQYRPTHLVIHSVAKGMRQLCETITELEDGLMAANGQGQLPAVANAGALQQIDLVFQMAEEISLLLERLADKIPVEHEINAYDLTSLVRLERLRAIFETMPPAQQPRSEGAPQARVTLF